MNFSKGKEILSMKTKAMIARILLIVSIICAYNRILTAQSDPDITSFRQPSGNSSDLPASSLPVLATSSGCRNIILHPNLNVYQTETSIAADPTNIARLLVGDNTSLLGNPSNLLFEGYYYSTNRALNWSGTDSLTIPPDTLSDPAVGIDQNSNYYFCFLRK